MDSDSDIIYDSEPDRLAESTKPLSPRNHLRRTSDERPTLSSEGSTAELEKVRARRKPQIERQEKSQEVLVLDSGSENDQEATITKSRFFRQPDSPPKRRRTRSPPAVACGDTGEDEGWPFSGNVKIGSRSPPPASRRSTSRSPSVSFSSVSSSKEPACARLRHPIASTSKVSRTSKTPSPFTSARDLLNSRPTPPRDPLEYSPSPDEPTTKPSLRSKPTSTDSARARSKPKSKPLKETLSASSIEFVESDDLEKGREQKKKGKGKGKQATETDEREMSDDLISPETWADQFKFKKDKTTKKGSRRVREKEKEEVSGGSMSESQRKKPWEVLEAKFDPAAKKKKKVDKIAVGKEAKKEEIEENESEDLEELEVFASNSSLSTALKPCPSGRLSHPGLDPAFVKKKPRTKTEHESLDHESLFDAPPPLVLPSDDRLKCLSHCPLCAFASTHDRARIATDSWGSKSLASRQTHLRNCAKSHDYHSSTVSHLVNQQILILSTESEEKRLERDLGKTLFDRAIGKGEGTGGGKQVTVTGLEGSTAVRGYKEWFDDLRGVQEEIDRERKKIKRGGIEERLKRNAKEIRQELEKNAKKGGTGTETEFEVEEDGEGYAMPRPTGRLRPETEEDRDQVAKRAKELLDLANGTQLTRKSFLVIDEDTSMDAQGQDQDDLFLPPPPATQPFEDSTLAKRCQHDGAINVVRPLAASTPGRSAPGFQDLDLALSSDEEYNRPRTSSLWKANAGNEETYLSRVVYSSPVHSGSPPRRQLPRTSSPLVSPASALNPHLSTLTLSSSSSTSSISSLPDPSFLMRRFDSSRGLVTSRRKSQSPSPSTGRRRVGRPRKESTSSNGEAAVEILGSGDEGEQGGGAGEMEWMDVGDEGWNKDGGMLVGGAGMSSDAEGAASSEEEPLATVLARTPINSIRKKKRKSPSPVNASPAAKTQPARKRISPSSEPESPHALSQGKKKVMATTKRSVDPPDMPAYSSLPLTTLHKEVQKYGYRPSKEKSVVVQQLKEIWKAINKDKVEAWERGEVEEVAKKTRAKGKKKVTEGEEAEEPKKTKGRRRRRIAPAESGDDEEVEGETRTVGERLRELIVNDTDLYLRILRYEPIHLDEFILLAANNNVKVARQLLIRCLDEQSITFYQEDPTNGQRARHK